MRPPNCHVNTNEDTRAARAASTAANESRKIHF